MGLRCPKSISKICVFIIVILVVGVGLVPVTAQTETVSIITAQQNANVREASSTNSAIVGSLAVGQTAPVLEENSSGQNVEGNSLWYRVRLSNNAEGWVWSGVVTIAEVAPTPTLVDQKPTLTAGDTLVTIAPVESLVASLAGYPTSVDFQPNFTRIPQWVTPVHVEMNPNTLRPFIGLNEQIIVPGWYSKRPSALATIFADTNRQVARGNFSNGVELEFSYAVGWVTKVVTLGDLNGPVQASLTFITFPARYVDTNGRVTQEDSSRHYITVAWGQNGTGNAIYAVNEKGEILDPGTTYNGGAFDFDGAGTHRDTMITINHNGVITFPSSGGVQELQASDPIIMQIINNAVEAGLFASNINGNHTVTEVITSLMDNDPTNDIGYEFTDTRGEVWREPIPILPQYMMFTTQNSRRVIPTATPTPTLTTTPTLKPTNTPLPSRTPLPTATATPIPVVLFQADFEDGNLSQWIDQSSIGRIVSDGNNHILRLENNSDQYASLMLPINTGDFAAEMRLRFLRSNADATDLFFGVRDTAQGGYNANLDIESRAYGIASFLDGIWNDLAAATGSLRLDEWVTLRMEARGEVLTLSLNGGTPLQATNIRISEGGMSITLAPHTIVEIDDVRVLALGDT